MTGKHRTLLSVFAMMAMLLSAGGIAYMASISYPDELGIVDARLRKHQERAVQIADALRQRIDENLRYQSSLSLQQLGGEVRGSITFVFASDGTLLFPSLQPLRAELGATKEGVVPQKGFQARQRALNRARKLEHMECGLQWDTCAQNSSDLRSAETVYESLRSFSDTGAEALLGLARIHRKRDQGELAARRYGELSEEFADRVNESDVPYILLADIGVSEVSQTSETRFSLLRNLLGKRYHAPNSLLEVVASQATLALHALALNESEQTQLAQIEKALKVAQADSVLAVKLVAHQSQLQRNADQDLRSRVAPWDPEKNLVFRVKEDGRIYGIILSETELQKMAIVAASTLGLHKALVVRVQPMREDSVANSARKARVSLGPLLPHLALVLWNQEKGGDALADIAEVRRRHRAITGGLVVVLVLALLATVRGAARERELARLKSDFVSTVSHELKTPLTSIRMFAEMLQEGVAGQDRARESRYHGIIVKESERLGLLIANLLDYSQIERGIRQYTGSEATASEIAEQAVQTFSRMQGESEQALTLEIADDAKSVAVHVDQEVIVQCLINLLSNAAKYGEGKPIVVRVQRATRASVVELQVIDLGPGIPAAEQQKVFREFYRTPEAMKSAIEGTGLGLALVKRHVEAQGGTTFVTSVPGEGASFTIQLPVSSRD